MTIGQVLRAVGFAQTPKLLTVVGFIPILGGLIAFVAWIWYLVASIIALRQAFDFTTGRAIGTAIVAIVVQVIALVIIGLILGIGAAVFGAAV